MLSTFSALSQTQRGALETTSLADAIVTEWAPGIFRLLQALCHLYVTWK